MAKKYIDADEFIKLKREWYCEQCEKRMDMKQGRLQFVYEIGDAPCRACYVDDIISDIEDFPAADVAPIVHARWVKMTGMMPPEFAGRHRCSRCGWCESPRNKEWLSPCCPNCHAWMDQEEMSDGK